MGSLMDPTPSPPLQPRLRGLDPDLLLGVLEDDVLESPPVIPGWRVTGVAGSGGTGIVWRAHRESDGVEAAVKIAQPDDPDTIERIEQEAATLRGFDHPHIVRLIEAGPMEQGDEAGGMFMAMEFIDGPALLNEIPEQGLPPQRALAWFSQIAEAVAHAHDAGILHRDLKPGNVLLASTGNIKVADFGLARPVHRRVNQLSVTRAGLVAGTAEYLPPEAYRRDYHPDASGDIFALGVMLHEMLTGTPPRGAWKPASHRRGVDVRIDDIISRAMDPDPAKRWKDARAMDAALREVAASPPRFSGVPLVTFPVRVADGLWTALGCFVLSASAASMLRLEQSQAALPFDLIGGHGRLTGGFQAVFFLLLAALPVAIWQIARLRRFRHVPLREALPSPFGLNLGSSGLAAALVALAQALLLWLPSLLVISIFLSTCLSWIRPDDPPWIHGLAVTRLDDHELLDPWTTVESPYGFWLRETYGKPSHGLAKEVDRISFIPFYGPLLMVFCGSVLAAALVLTSFTACREWWRRARRWGSVASLATTAAIAALIWGSAGHELRATAARRTAADNWVIDAHMTSRVRDHADFLLGKRPPRDQDTGWTALYAETVDYRGHGTVKREAIPALRENPPGRTETTTLEIIQYEQSWDPADESFTVTARAIECIDGAAAHASSGADDLRLELYGIIRLDGTVQIRHEKLTRTPMYRAAKTAATRQDAERWLQRLLAAATHVDTDPVASDRVLADLFLAVPGGFPDETFTGWLRRIPNHRGGLPTLLGAELRRSGRLDFHIRGSRPGGRTRIELPFGGEQGRPTRVLVLDLVNADDTWRCVKLAF